MRQVPSFLIIGNGRVARHYAHYFSLLNIPFTSWHRPQPFAELTEKTQAATSILILISDSQIEPFIDNHLANVSAQRIHFSGALQTKFAYGAHPLMTFGHSLYDLAHYQKIPFILDENAPDFATLLPHLTNPHMRLKPEHKAKYHALCVLSGNFSCILWQKLFDTFETEFGLAPELAHLYCAQQSNNLIHDAKNALTGPLVRNDQLTIQKNINALNNDVFQDIYKSFVACYQKINEEKTK